MINLTKTNYTVTGVNGVAERTFAWLGRYGVHSRDYERTTASGEARIRVGMIHLMLGRLAPRALGSPYR